MIVSGDPDLLVLGAHQGIDIVAPRGFIERIQGGLAPK
jgi:predicted nucleic acid-binding protein